MAMEPGLRREAVADLMSASILPLTSWTTSFLLLSEAMPLER
jgi:hypothetical protein